MSKSSAAIDKLEAAIDAIRRRNARVEVEKAWEQSWFRRLLIVAFIYVTTCLLITLMKNSHEQAWLPALVPAAGYLLSTLSIPWAKKLWMKRWIRKYHERKQQRMASALLQTAKKKASGGKKKKKK